MAATQNRRAPGEVRDAIVSSLSKKPEGASVQEIRAAVQRKLDGEVAASSVRSYLQLGTPARFTRIEHGRYKLADK